MSHSAQSQPSSLTSLDTETARLGQSQARLLSLLIECAEKHQKIDEEYAARVNASLQETQELFDRVTALAADNREAIIRRGTKTAKRMTGRHSWRNVTRVDQEVSDEEIVDQIRSLGPRISRKLLRWIKRVELDKQSCALIANADIVRQVPGLTVTTTEEFYSTPSGGFQMATSRRIFPGMEGLPMPGVLEALLRDPDS